MQPEILYEDNHLLMVTKPVNVPVQADRSQDLDLLTALKEFIRQRDNKPGNVYLGLVHRLDRPVGGAIVFAKTSKAASRLANSLRLRQMTRRYLAVVHGSLPVGPAKQVVDYLAKDTRRNHSAVVDARHPQAKKAVLHYQVLANTADHSLIEVELETGRSHQIRVQMANLGHPLYGDQRYATDITPANQQIALWASELTVIHPTRREPVPVVSLPPLDVAPWQDYAPVIRAHFKKS